MTQLTIKGILAWEPCAEYDVDRLSELFGSRSSVPLADALRDERVPIRHRIWICAHTARATAWAERIVSRSVRNHALNCGVEEVEAWAAKWLSGEDRSGAAARAAARAADTAVLAAAAKAAMGSAWAARTTGSADMAVAWAAAGADAREAEKLQQIQDMLAVLAEGERVTSGDYHINSKLEENTQCD